MRTVELVVVGGGPAGQAAALLAGQSGLETILIDEQPLAPASAARNIPYWFGSRGAGRRLTADTVGRWFEGQPGLQAALDAGVEVLTGHTVFGAFAETTLGISDGTTTWGLRARQVILAPGATDLHLAFPGWTLGGVLGGLGALHLLRTYGHLDGARRLVILGTGHLARAVACAARAADITVAGLVGIGPAADALAAAADPVYAYHTIAAADGRAEVERVRLRPLAPAAPGAEVELAADTLVVAIGRQPAVELAALFGCALAFDPAAGGWLVRHDAAQRTTIPQVLVAGDVCGTSDADFATPTRAQATARQAAQTALAALRAPSRPARASTPSLPHHPPTSVASSSQSPADDQSTPSGPAGRSNSYTSEDHLIPSPVGDQSSPAIPVDQSIPSTLGDRSSPAILSTADGTSTADAAFLTPWHALAEFMAHPALVVCRCEEVTRADVLAAIDLVGTDPDDVKRLSRAGMGLCQGRGCRPLVASLLAARAGISLADLPPTSYRPPIRPVPLAALATEPEDAREPPTFVTRRISP